MILTQLKTTRDFIQQRSLEGSKVGVINLGCARNLVDSQMILGRLKKNGYRIVDPLDSEVVIVNTCAFIEEAKKESIDCILELLDLKKQGKIRKLIVAGCLVQRYASELAQEFKEVDALIGIPTLPKGQMPPQYRLTPAYFAYVKICESCFNQCSFCAIPKIKGKFSSRTIESILAEVKELDRQGVKEINIIGQDITAYGMDLYRSKSLTRLLKEIVRATQNIQWVRLLYAFPAHVTDELIDCIANEEKICKYIDLPLQHISDHILGDMNRGIGQQETIQLIAKIRNRIPGASLRTTFIVGFPGETEEDFKELYQFVTQTQFERLGVFVYSKEEGTLAYHLPSQVPAPLKKKRLRILMQTQQGISRKLQERFLGKKLKVLIEERQKPGVGDPKNQGHVYLGRSEYDAPEVDGLVYVHSAKPLKSGDFVQVEITDTYEYDLAGELV